MRVIAFNCPHCDQPLEAPSDMAELSISCPVCSQQLVIPVHWCASSSRPGKPEVSSSKTITPDSAKKANLIRNIVRCIVFILSLAVVAYVFSHLLSAKRSAPGGETSVKTGAGGAQYEQEQDKADKLLPVASSDAANASYPFFVSVDDKWGVVNRSGQYLVNPVFDAVLPYSENIAAVQRNGTWLFVDRKMQPVFTNTYDAVDFFSEGLAAVCCGERWGFIDNKGIKVIPCVYHAVNHFRNGMASATIDGKSGSWGFIDRSGKIAIPMRFDAVLSFSSGLAAVDIAGRWGFIDKTGRLVISNVFAHAKSFKNGLAAVILPGPLVKDSIGEYFKHTARWGFIDASGRFVIEPQFYDAHSFSEGLAAVNMSSDLVDQKWGYIDTSGRLVINPIYRSAGEFLNGLGIVEGEERHVTSGVVSTYGCVNKTGRVVVPIEFAHLGINFQGLFPAQRDYGALFGLIDGHGRFVVTPQFSEIKVTTDGDE